MKTVFETTSGGVVLYGHQAYSDIVRGKGKGGHDLAKGETLALAFLFQRSPALYARLLLFEL